jgi:excisionase family DNA binding protein
MGDGSVLVKPGKVIHELTPAQAARHLGVHRNTIYAYIDAGVLRKVRRPSPSRILLEAEEVTALRQATQDPEYWTRERRIQLTCGKHCA